MSDSKPTDNSSLTTLPDGTGEGEFPPDVHASLAALRKLSLEVRSLEEWKERGRKATEGRSR